MRATEIKERLAACGLPCAYWLFPEGDAPELPYVVWYIPGERNFAADGENYHNIKQLTVELYTVRKEPEREEAVEAVLSALGVWTKTEEYIDAEKCFQIVYYLEV